MPRSDFITLRVNDAQIIKVVLDKAVVCVSIRDWKEGIQCIEFVEVIGIEAFGLFGVDLGGVCESLSDSFIDRACSMNEEPNIGFTCYSFLSAWTGEPLLRIVAKSWQRTDDPQSRQN